MDTRSTAHGSVMEHDVPLCFCGKGVGSTCLQCCDVSLSSFLVTLKNVLQLRSIRKIVLQPMMHAEKDSSRKLAFFLSLRLFNFEALLESFVNHVLQCESTYGNEHSPSFLTFLTFYIFYTDEPPKDRILNRWQAKRGALQSIKLLNWNG